MEKEKKEIKMSLWTFYVLMTAMVLLITALIIGGLKLYEKNNIPQATPQIQKQDEDKIIQKQENNKETINGIFSENGDFFSDAPAYIFSNDGTVEESANFSSFGNYTINGNKITVNFTEEEDGDWNRVKLSNERKETFIIKDEDTLLLKLDDGTEYEYLREKEAKIENICGTWKNYEEFTNEFIKFNKDGSYQYSMQQYNGNEIIEDSGTYSLSENNITLKSNNGIEGTLLYTHGRYLIFNQYLKVLINENGQNNSSSKYSDKNKILLEGTYAFEASDVGYEFDKKGNVSILGNVDEQKGTYTTVGKNEIEIVLTVETVWDDETGESTSTPINRTERLKVIDENTLLINNEKLMKFENGEFVR